MNIWIHVKLGSRVNIGISLPMVVRVNTYTGKYMDTYKIKVTRKYRDTCKYMSTCKSMDTGNYMDTCEIRVTRKYRDTCKYRGAYGNIGIRV